jgi:hypothetical protein
MISFKKLFACGVLGGALASASFAQETQTRVVDEVVAQVNDSVITLSRVKREMKDIVDADVQKGKNREEAQKYVDERQGELIANLINEELILQKAKDIGLEKDIDAAVNERVLDMMKQNNLKTVEALYAEMQRSGMNPEDFRSSLRSQITRERVLQQDLQSKVYWGFSAKELKDYYDKHRDKFTRPEMISVSELYLGFAGRDINAVKEKAKQLYDQLKGGADFDKLAKENGDPGIVTQGAGKAEHLHVAELSPVLGGPLTGLKVGEFTQPFQAEELGMIILKVDKREAASNESVFEENAVRMALLNERFGDEQKKYFAKLRSDAYIKLGEAYRPLVSPILFADERKDKAN